MEYNIYVIRVIKPLEQLIDCTTIKTRAYNIREIYAKKNNIPLSCIKVSKEVRESSSPYKVTVLLNPLKKYDVHQLTLAVDFMQSTDLTELEVKTIKYRYSKSKRALAIHLYANSDMECLSKLSLFLERQLVNIVNKYEEIKS